MREFTHRPLSKRALTAAACAVLLAPLTLLTACGPDQSRATAPATAVAATPGSQPPVSVTPSPIAEEPSPSPSSPAPAATPTPAHSTAQARPTTPQLPPPPPAGDASIIHATASGGRTVALTFDDGPGPATRPILDLLAQYHAHATFCEVGNNVRADPGLVQQVLAGGHRLCDHTVDHPQPMHTLPHDKQAYEITAARDWIVKAGGPGTQVTWFRAPGGDFTPDNRQIAAQAGMSSLGWTVDPRDWSRPGVSAIVTRVQQQLRPGGIVLMHDGGGDRSQTVAALKILLPWLVSQGYTFDFPAS